jgi:NNP family nitrate/nitrite transporter-like MFS transporter
MEGDGGALTPPGRSRAMIDLLEPFGALGGAAIDIAFKLSYSDGSGSGAPAFLAFLGYYALCTVLIRTVYLRRGPAGPTAPIDRFEAADRV